MLPRLKAGVPKPSRVPVMPSPPGLKSLLYTSVSFAFDLSADLSPAPDAPVLPFAALLSEDAAAGAEDDEAATLLLPSSSGAAAAFRFLLAGNLSRSLSSSSPSGANGIKSLSMSNALPVTGQSVSFSSFSDFGDSTAPEAQMSTAREEPASRSSRDTGQTIRLRPSSFSASFQVIRHGFTSLSARICDISFGIFLFSSALIRDSLL
mmetsp:Transcript_158527/g.508583  ORF Transcript_158527/g.508583 Transcript_158527/m.508583 type:complete len:207 (+) Transcript_158527:82-702(+)